MADEMVDVKVAPDETVEEPIYASDDYQVFVDDAGAAAPDTATQALLDDLKSKQAELAAAQARADPVAAMQSGIAALGDRLMPQTKPDTSVRAQQIDLAKLREEYNKSVYEDPYTKTAELFQTFQNLTGVQQANANLAYAKRIVQVDPATKDLYKRFEAEIEGEVAKMPPQERASNPAIYDDALLRVKARHMDELFGERLAEELKKVQATGAQTPAAGPKSFSEGGGVRAPGIASPATTGAGRTIRMTASKKSEIEAFASAHIIPFDAALRIYEKRGLLK